MAVRQKALPLNYFYTQTDGIEHLSQNLASSDLLTPLQWDRFTVSPSRFVQYRARSEKRPRLPWGRTRDYGGLHCVQLPDEFIKPKTYPPEVVQKGHRHYGSGANDSRDLSVQQFYDMTNLRCSDVRTNDQLLPPCFSKEIAEKQINLPFPAEPPYSSHMSRHALIPNFNTPDDPVTGDPNCLSSPLHTNAPASPFRVLITCKAKGSPYRKEIQECLFESEKKPLKWVGEKDFYQQLKSPTAGRQPFYPIPPKVVHPNMLLRNENQRIEQRSTNVLLNTVRDQWKTDYQYNFTGYGPSNAMHLDDYHKKVVAEIAEDRDPRNDELAPNSVPAFTSPRPLEGRYARLYQGRRPITDSIQHPVVSNSNKDIPDVMDEGCYKLLPYNRSQVRRKDNCRYKARPFEGTSAVRAEEDVWGEYFLEGAERDDDAYRCLVTRRNVEEAASKSVNVERPATPLGDESLTIRHGEHDHATEGQTYLRDYGLDCDSKNKDIERFHEQEKLEMQYLREHDMHALRNKINQMGNRMEAKALDQHALQAFGDAVLMQGILGRNESWEQFDTGMKLSTKKISDSGKVSYMHDRQLGRYQDQSSTCRRVIPRVESPRQNHRGVIVNYFVRSNPFSLSLVTARSAPQDERTATRNNFSTKSILKTSGSRRGENKSISFKEAVDIPEAVYSGRHQETTSHVSEADERPQARRPTSGLSIPSRSISRELSSKIQRITKTSVQHDVSSDRPILRSQTHSSAPVYNDSWCWNYDHRFDADIEPLSLITNLKTARPQTSLLDMQDNWSKSDVHHRLHEDFPELAPDYRDNTRLYELADKSSDLRFTRSTPHREKRHQFYG